MKFTELAEKTGLSVERCEGDCKIEGIEYDSRKVSSGDLFVAIKGAKADGHDFIKEALASGASAILGEKPIVELGVRPERYLRSRNSRKSLGQVSDLFFGSPTEDIIAIGITGTNGKTTTAHLIKHLLGEERTELVSTVNLDQKKGEKNPVTTPEAPTIHKMAKGALNRDKKFLVMEVSSHALSLHRTAGVSFNLAVFTNISRDHLNFHRSMEQYKKAKLRLFEKLGPSATAVINSDEDFSSTISSKTSAQTLSYGINSPSDVQASRIESSKKGVQFVLRRGEKNTEVESSLVGRYNVYNLLAGSAAAIKLGRKVEAISEDIPNFSGPEGRMDKISHPEGGDVFIDFAHTPEALEKSLETLNNLYEKTTVVFGCGGESDRGKRPLMGSIASRFADLPIVTNDNPKGEDPAEIINQIKEGMESEENFSVIPDRKEAIKKGLENLSADEALLIAGKGHERYQIIGDRWKKQSDKNLVKKELRRIQ